MEFIEPNNRKGSKDENLLMRRSQRKMKKTDECKYNLEQFICIAYEF